MKQVIVSCPFCGKTEIIEVDPAKYEKWQNHELLIQEAFPEMSPDKREQLKTGICPECWDEMFGGNE